MKAPGKIIFGYSLGYSEKQAYKFYDLLITTLVWEKVCDAKIGQHKIVFSLSFKIIIVFMYFEATMRRDYYEKGDCKKDKNFSAKHDIFEKS